MNMKSSTVIGMLCIALAVLGIVLTVAYPKAPSALVLFATLLLGGLHIVFPASKLLKTGVVVWVAGTCALLALAGILSFLAGPDDTMLEYGFVFLLNLALLIVWARFAPKAYVAGVC